MNRDQVCSQQIHCLSCPLSVGRTGKPCEELTADEIRMIIPDDKTIRLIPILTGYACSECGAHYSHMEYEIYYSRYQMNCKMCGAVFGKLKNEKE